MKISLAPILIASLILLSGGLVESYQLKGAWLFVFLAGLGVGATSTKWRYMTSLVILSVWLFIGYFTPLNYSFGFFNTGYEKYYLEPVVDLFYKSAGAGGLSIIVWILILATNWLGVFIGTAVQERISKKESF
mgnify:CR=1 FL=1